jgi:hypothetical protein
MNRTISNVTCERSIEVQHATNSKKKSKSGRAKTTKGSALKSAQTTKQVPFFFLPFPLCGATRSILQAIECAVQKNCGVKNASGKKELRSRTMILSLFLLFFFYFFSWFSFMYAYRRGKGDWRNREDIGRSRFMKAGSSTQHKTREKEKRKNIE